MNRRRSYRRGYPVAILAGLDEDRAVVWRVFSNVVKPDKTVWLGTDRNDAKAVYNFHESIVNTLRPVLKEGVRSIMLAAPPKTSYAQEFVKHVRQHHVWLTQGPNMAVFSQTVGTANTLSEVARLARTPEFRRLISDTASEESDNLVETLEKHLQTSNTSSAVLYSLREIEDLVLGQWKKGKPKPEYLLLTNKYLSNSSEKNRINRLVQVAKNKYVKTRIVDAETAAGIRITQLGGLVCFTDSD